MAYKQFSPGEILAAADVNTNLMEQVIATFATASARDAAITSPKDGQSVFVADQDVVLIYDDTTNVSASGWKPFPHIAKVNAAASGNYTLSASDAGAVIDVNSNGTSSVRIPAASTVNFPTNTVITILQSGASPTFITACTAASWVSFTKPAASVASGSLAGRYAVATLIKSSSNTWYAFGNLA
jgi:hypothetical protein